MTTCIPNCLFPTTVLVVDDDARYLQAFALSEPVETMLYQTNQYSDQALTFLNTHHSQANFLKGWVDTLDSNSFEHRVLDVNVQDLHKEVYNPKRFQQISTVLVDYDMPEMNGVEFCQKIQNPFIQKILVTGAADEHLAVDAFNKRIIDGFVRKQHPRFTQQIQENLIRAQENYFGKVMKIMQEALALGNSALNDPAFIEIFKKIIEEKKIIEYYQFESTGSFLMLDGKGQSYALFTYSEDKIQADCLEISNDVEDELPPALKEAILSKEKMLCFHSEQGKLLPEPSDWPKYLLPAQKIEGNQVYYYAFQPQGILLDDSQITSFEDYKFSL